MANSKVIIDWDGGGTPIVCRLVDKDGVNHNMRKIFRRAGGRTVSDLESGQAVVESELKLIKDSSYATLRFTPLSRKIVMEVPEEISKQIAELLTD